MAATEDEIIRDEQERSNLLRAMANVETAIAAATPGTRRILEASLAGMKSRISALEKKIEETKTERAAEVQAQTVTAAALAAKEAKLSAEEKETYRGFLEKAYFTKQDFGKLDEFYAHGYDRLSEGGKDAMSKRFWEGVKRGEYQFGEAPSTIQRKEADRAKSHLGLDDLSAEQLRGMSNEEQREFANAYSLDKHAEAKRILARSKSTGHNITGPSVLTGNHPSVDDKSPVVVTDIDLSSVDLKMVKLADACSPPSAASIPNSSVSKLVERG